MRYFIELQKNDGTGSGTVTTVHRCTTEEKRVAFAAFDRYIDDVRRGTVDADGVQLYAGRDQWSADLVESWARIASPREVLV